MDRLRIEKKKILVIGDVMLDIYFEGDIDRISPEAPVPVFRQRTERYVPGGAANVATNLVAAGQCVSLMSMIGRDKNGDRLAGLLDGLGISTELMIRTDRPTTSKTRFLANGGQQIMRSDIEDEEEASEEDVERFIEKLRAVIQDYDAVVISDYRKGLITYELARAVIGLCNERGIKILADIKDNRRGKYNGVFFIKPNKKELAALTGSDFNSDEDVKKAAEKLRVEMDCRYVLTTLGAKGMLLVGENGSFAVPSVAREIFDVTGAGDTAISYITACIVNEMDIRRSVMIANVASGIEVGKVGTSCVKVEEVEEYLKKNEDGVRNTGERGPKIYNRDRVAALRDNLNGKKVVFTNGCFDILHVGHVRYLCEAKKLGDVLIVGVNSDDSVRRLKGEKRPWNSLEDRMEILAALKCVDYVIPFREDTPYNLILDIKPDILVKGGDYKPKDVVGKDIVEAGGGKVVIIPIVEGKSTTSIIDKIR